MEGVFILNEYVMASPYAFSWLTAFIIMGIGIVCGIFYGFAQKSAFGAAAIIGAVLIMALLLGGIVGVIYPTEQHQVTYYQVEVSDMVSFNDFMHKYEIVDKNGEIYTVKERKDY